MLYLDSLKEVLAGNLLESAGLWALLALIPIILAYLIRPRPKHKTVPALIFLMKDRTRADKRSFLRKILKDPLLLFQILVIIIFAITIARPYMTVNEEVFVEKTAILIDTSASSQVEIDSKTRFERSIEIAKEHLSSKNTIIAMSGIPEVIASEIDSTKAKEELNTLRPRDTPSAIFDSLMFAANYVQEDDKILVISDFIDTSSKDFKTAKSIIESKGIIVEFINLRDLESRKAKNIGIIDVDVGEEQTTVLIKNYNDEDETVGVDIEGMKLSMNTVFIAAKGVESLTFPTQWGLARFWITPKAGNDDFDLDDEVYLSSPSREKTDLLWISNRDSRYLSTALDVLGTVNLQRGTPPKVPDIAHPITIISDLNDDLMLPGTIRNIRENVEAGASLVIFAQKDLDEIDFEGLLPVQRASNSEPIFIEHEVAVITEADTYITEDINFGMVDHYLKVKPRDGATTLASTTNDVPMIVLKSYGAGMVVYFGFMELYSNFKQDIYYPVFWKRLFDMFLKKQELSELNFRTGKRLALLDEQRIEAPKGIIRADTILLSHQGIYRTDEKNFVANLILDDESNINGDSLKENNKLLPGDLKNEEEVPLELAWYFMIALIVLIFIELLWVKFRGDL